MFGYVRPLVRDLRVGEYEYYRAAYCGLCRKMGKTLGCTSRFTLSYDIVVLFLLRTALSGKTPEVSKHCCPVNPAARRRMTEETPELEYAAAVSGMLAHYHFEDDRSDNRGCRRFAAGCGCRVSAGWMRRAEKLYPGLSEGIAERMRALEAYQRSFACNKDSAKGDNKEASGASASGGLKEPGGEINTDNRPSADEAANLFGELLSFVCAFGLERGSNAEAVASAVGKYTGRWIYCIDAIDDMHNDAKSGSFNAFLSLYGTPELSEEEKVTLSCLLGAEAGAAADALYLADEAADGDRTVFAVLENILTAGMPYVAGEVLAGRYKKPEREKLGPTS